MHSDARQWNVTIRAMPCEDYIDKGECERAKCYWYNDSCHTNPPPFPWVLVIAGATIAATAVGGYILWKRYR